MQFNSDFQPNRDGLPAAIAPMMDRAFYTRRAAGLNVQFIREDGALDEFSLATAERRDAFVAALQRQGKDYAISA